MIIPETSLVKFRDDPQAGQFALTYPMAFFGWHIHYPKQAEILRRYLEVQPKILVVSGWKRTAKTALGAYLGSCWLLGKLDHNWPGAKKMGIPQSYSWAAARYRGYRASLIGGSSFDHVEKILLKEYENILPPAHIKHWFSQANKTISLHDGSYAVVKTYDQKIEAWKSGAYHLIHLDEEPPHEVLMECLERTRTTRGKIIITVALDDADLSYLPEACDNPKKIFGTDSFMHYQLGVEDVPEEIYPQEEKIIVFNQYDGTPLEKAVRKGAWANVGGKWWGNFNPDYHVIKTFEPPKDWKRYRFIDAGYSAPTACIWIALHPSEPILFAYRELYKKGLNIDQRCREIIEMSGNERKKDGVLYVEQPKREYFEMTILDYHEFKVDHVTGDGLDYQYVKSGLQVQQSTTLDQQGRRMIIDKFLWLDKRERHFISHELGAPRLYIMDCCYNLIAEAKKKNVRKESSEKTSISERKVMNRDDHAMDCLEYACAELGWLAEDREIL